jgi:hypothetical protein
VFVKLDLSREGQLDRLANADRGKFGKLRDTDLLEVNFDQMEASIQAMPEPDLVLNTGRLSADVAARQIVDLIKPAS